MKLAAKIKIFNSFFQYFKQTWVGSTLCGGSNQIWFAWHRICMISTWLLTMAAFILIFIELNGWSTAINPHAVLGTITTILCFIQPIGAFFRPHPGTKRRPFFNLIHWLLGNLRLSKKTGHHFTQH